MLTLQGRTAAVIGIGREGVRELVEAGMNVSIFTHSPDFTQGIVDSLGESAVREHLLVIQDAMVDVDKTAIAALQQTYERFGSVDCIVVFSGGPGTVLPLEEVTVEAINKEVPYLTASSYNLVRHALPYLKQSRAPRVVFISTTEAQTGGTNSGFLDSIARGAILSLTYNLAKRVAEFGITVNCISVGPFDKCMPHWKKMEGIPDPYAILDQVPLKKMGTPKDVAAALHYLLSEEADFITGQVINLNGGLFMG